ncbi:MAG: hypothetical protein ABL911_09490 [Gallionella sp.]|jgi:hypothetical protein
MPLIGDKNVTLPFGLFVIGAERSDEAQRDFDQSAIQLISGVMRCGFMPREFLSKCMHLT